MRWLRYRLHVPLVVLATIMLVAFGGAAVLGVVAHQSWLELGPDFLVVGAALVVLRRPFLRCANCGGYLVRGSAMVTEADGSQTHFECHPGRRCRRCGVAILLSDRCVTDRDGGRAHLVCPRAGSC